MAFKVAIIEQNIYHETSYQVFVISRKKTFLRNKLYFAQLFIFQPLIGNRSFKFLRIYKKVDDL